MLTERRTGILALLSIRKQDKFRLIMVENREILRRVEQQGEKGEGTGNRVMDMPVKRIKISVGGVSLEAELKSNKTAEAIYAALPVEAACNVWGEEFYFKMPGVKDHREVATTQVKVGDVAFWGAGEVLAIFFGRTPMSMGTDPVPADRVNVVGRIVGDATRLRHATNPTTIRVEKA